MTGKHPWNESRTDYDNFLGYMEGVLPPIDGGHDGFII